MLFFALTGAAVAMIAGYLLGYIHGRGDSKATWKAVFEELRDFDEAPRN